MRRNTPADFWAKVAIGKPDECWPWTAATIKGYGSMSWCGGTIRAHRVAYQLHHGVTLPKFTKASKDATVVMHTCDNPPCCNPAHLVLGTQLDNGRDSIAKGRANKASGDRHHFRRFPETVLRGAKNGHAKLTERQVNHIKSRIADGDRLSDIAREYHVGITTISEIKQRRTWRHL